MRASALHSDIEALSYKKRVPIRKQMVTFCDCMLGGFLGQELHAPEGGGDKVDFRIDRRSETGKWACSEGAAGESVPRVQGEDP